MLKKTFFFKGIEKHDFILGKNTPPALHQGPRGFPGARHPPFHGRSVAGSPGVTAPGPALAVTPLPRRPYPPLCAPFPRAASLRRPPPLSWRWCRAGADRAGADGFVPGVLGRPGPAETELKAQTSDGEPPRDPVMGVGKVPPLSGRGENFPGAAVFFLPRNLPRMPAAASFFGFLGTNPAKKNNN